MSRHLPRMGALVLVLIILAVAGIYGYPALMAGRQNGLARHTDPAIPSGQAAPSSAETMLLKPGEPWPPALTKSGDPVSTFFVRPDGPDGALIAYDPADGAMLFQLPPGQLSADGTHYFTAMPTSVNQDGSPLVSDAPAGASPSPGTRLDTYDPRLGLLRRTATFTGTWMLTGVAPNGRWVVLTEFPAIAPNPASARPDAQPADQQPSYPQSIEPQPVDSQPAYPQPADPRSVDPQSVDPQPAGPQPADPLTTIQVIDTENGQIARRLELHGQYQVETISASGTALFVIEHLAPKVAVERLQEEGELDTDADQEAKFPHYVVELYDFEEGGEEPSPIAFVQKSEKIMVGLAWGGVAYPEGNWLFTLYLDAKRKSAFIHALNLTDHYPICIDLPSDNGDLGTLKDYVLTLAPDGKTIYAANATLGVVAEVDLSADGESWKVSHVATVENKDRGIDSAAPAGRAFLSVDGRTLYFTAGRDIWAYDVAKQQIGPPFPHRCCDVAGLGVSSDGRWLWVVERSGGRVAYQLGCAAGSPLTAQ